MTTQIISNPARVWAFVNGFSPVQWAPKMKGIGLERNDALAAGVLYEGFNGSNVWMHVAAVPGARWMTREFLNYSFHYPFVEMRAQRISGWVEASNLCARKFDEHLGFTHEATLSGAARDGGDVLIYRMRREDCKYV